jgi:hypothetical protein
MNEVPLRPPINYALEISRSFYEIIRDKENSFSYPTTSHLPDNISNRLEGVTVGDSIIFHCETPVGEYSNDIERVVVRIETDKKNFMRTLYFSKSEVPAWKKR